MKAFRVAPWLMAEEFCPPADPDGQCDGVAPRTARPGLPLTTRGPVATLGSRS